jgi:hypothetical protein
MCFLKKTTNNIFITITNSNCEPIFLVLMVGQRYLLKSVGNLLKLLRIN